MRAVQVRETGGPDVLQVADVAEPVADQGQVVVDVAAAGVNYIDTYHRGGMYPMPLPFVPGLEGAGTIREVGEGVSGFAVGDAVGWSSAIGSYAERIAVPVGSLIPLPAEVDLEVGAAALLQGLTAHYLVTSTYPVQQGDWTVVHAAAGGVGLLLTQMVKLRGGRVLATVSTPEKASLAREAGADEIASYDDFAARARELTGGTGVPVVFDGVGASTFDQSLDALRPRGLMVLYGASSGAVSAVDPQLLNSKGSLYLTRPTMGHYISDPAELRSRVEELFGWIRAGQLSVRIGGRYPLADAARAHEDLQGRRTTGKLLLLPG